MFSDVWFLIRACGSGFGRLTYDSGVALQTWWSVVIAISQMSSGASRCLFNACPGDPHGLELLDCEVINIR